MCAVVRSEAAMPTDTEIESRHVRCPGTRGARPIPMHHPEHTDETRVAARDHISLADTP